MSGDKGGVSEWNEGDLKNLRLHKAHEMINIGWANPFQKVFTPFNALMYGYESIIKGIGILFKEGMQKYSDKEYEKVLAMENDVEKNIFDKPICTQVKSWNNQILHKIDYTLWEEFKQKLKEFEYLVKSYNDTHGLGTRNREDDEGL